MTYLNKIAVRSVIVLALTAMFTTTMAQTAMVVYYFKNSGFLLPTIEGSDYFVTIYPPDTSINKDCR